MQAHDAQHLSVLLVDGNEGHGAGRIIVDKLIEQRMIHFVHRSEETQPQVLRCHVAEKIRIEGSVVRLESADQNRRSIAQDQMWLVKYHIGVSAAGNDARSDLASTGQYCTDSSEQMVGVAALHVRFAIISCGGAARSECPLYPRKLPRQSLTSVSALGH